MALTALTRLRKQIRLSRNLKSLVMATCLSAWLKPNIPSPMTMPGLPKVPAAEKIDVTDDGVISGLF